MLQLIKTFFQRRSKIKRMNRIRAAFNSGEPLSKFIARDVRRQIRIINIDELDSGFVVAQFKTDKVLYVSKNLIDKTEFGSAERISIDRLWEWSGKSWGGLSDGTSIADRVQSGGRTPRNDG